VAGIYSDCSTREIINICRNKVQLYTRTVALRYFRVSFVSELFSSKQQTFHLHLVCLSVCDSSFCGRMPSRTTGTLITRCLLYYLRHRSINRSINQLINLLIYKISPNNSKTKQRKAETEGNMRAFLS